MPADPEFIDLRSEPPGVIHSAQTEPPPVAAEIGGAGEMATDVSTPPMPADPEFIDLRSEPPGVIHSAQTEPPPVAAEIGGAGEVATDVSTPPTPADPEFVDLRSEPPGVPSYSVNGPFRRATQVEMDACIKKIAELDGGKTNRDTIRKWGRHWLRTCRNVDTTQAALVARFHDPEHDERHNPSGNPRFRG
jgi:hypothetical protein